MENENRCNGPCVSLDSISPWRVLQIQSSPPRMPSYALGREWGRETTKQIKIKHTGTTTHYMGWACSRARAVQLTYSRCTFHFCRSSAKVYGGVSIADVVEDDVSENNTDKEGKSSESAHHGILHEFWCSFPSPSLVLQLRRLEL